MQGAVIPLTARCAASAKRWWPSRSRG